MPRYTKKRIVFTAVGVGLAAVLLYQWWTGAPPTAPVAQIDAAGGSYAALVPAQRRLVDDWVERFTKASGQTVVARDLYDGLPLSTRTTFNAVTHALSRTALTDGSGQPMKLTALDLVARIDAVAGSNPEKGGDQQFRMYVGLRPDTQQTLERSREFSRQVDNTVYHKGYPICFRGAGGTPSIQFSLSPDGTRGDIDVDYRSSTFPIMLINGHLTASNSDVRAGNNDERHNGHWNGLVNWWRSFMGLPMTQVPETPAGAAGVMVSSAPRLGKGTKPEDAIADFLTAWLVEGNPGVAVGYVAPRAFACLEVERGTPVDRGVARFQMMRAMEAVTARIGKVASLSAVIRGVSLVGPRGKELPQPHRDAFVMYDVREDLAEAFSCENKLRPEQADVKKTQSTRFGEYVGAVFQVKTEQLTGESVATLWTRENGAWVLVAYDVEPEFTPGVLPSAPPTPAEAPEPAAPMIDGDPAMLQAAGAFLQAWFVRKDPAAAFRHLAPPAHACYNVYRSDDAPTAASPEDAGHLVQARMKTLADWAVLGPRLEDTLSAADPHHPDLKRVRHDAAAAFAIVAVPDAMAAAVDCATLKQGETPRFARDAAPTYGRFYAVSLRLKRAGADAAVFWTLWAKQGPAWKVVSYLVVTP